MTPREAVMRVPELHVLPVYWAAARLVATGLARDPDFEFVDGYDIDEILEEEAELILDGEGDDSHPLDHAAARILRAVSVDRRHVVAQDLLVQIGELTEE